MSTKTIIFTVGAEGTGHHAIMALLNPYFLREVVEKPNISRWHRELKNLWSKELTMRDELLDIYGFSFDSLFRQNSKPSLARATKYIKESFLSYDYLYQSASFPFERKPRQTLRRPDLISFERDVAPVFDVKYLFLWRDPRKCAESALRRGFTRRANLQAKIIEDNILYIASARRLIPEARRLTVDFDALCQRPDAEWKSIIKFLQLRESYINESLKYLKIPNGQGKSSAIKNKELEDFFSSYRTRNLRDIFYQEEGYEKPSFGVTDKSNVGSHRPCE